MDTFNNNSNSENSDSVYLINCISQYNDLRSDGAQKNYITDDYLLYINKTETVGYLYPEIKTNNYDHLRDVQHAALNWYKDESGKDLIQRNGISIGPIISRNVMASFVNDLRNYLAFEKILEEFDCIYISTRAPISFHRVSKVFGRRVKTYATKDKISLTNTSSPERIEIKEFPPIHKLTWVARAVQKLSLRYVRNRIILWRDWTYDNIFLNKYGFLSLNGINIFSSYYLRLLNNKNLREEAEYIFPDKMQHQQFNINDVVSRLVDGRWNDDLLCLFESTINRVYADCYIHLRRSYMIYKELLMYYTPKAIIIPGETHFAYLLAAQIAKVRKVKSALVVDGYPFLMDPSNVFSLHSKRQTVFDYYVAFSGLHVDMYGEFDNIDRKQVLRYQSPLVRRIKSQIKCPEYCIIISCIPYQLNANARWDKRVIMTCGVLDVLLAMGEKNIIIKVKDGVESKQESKIYRDYIDMNYGYINISVSIVVGEFNKIVHKANMVVGQISTALFESICAKVPYYIYAPYEAGVPDEFIVSSPVLSLNNVARTLEQLKVNILNKNNSMQFDRDYVVDGNNIEDLMIC